MKNTEIVITVKQLEENLGFFACIYCTSNLAREFKL